MLGDSNLPDIYKKFFMEDEAKKMSSTQYD